jgi:hypothetical protein
MTSARARCLALVVALVILGLALHLPASALICGTGNRSVMVQITVTQPVALAAVAPPSEIED